MQYRIQRSDAEVVLLKHALIFDTNLSADSLGMLSFVFALADSQYTLTQILHAWNKGRAKEKQVSADKFQRMAGEWQKAGLLAETHTKDAKGRIDESSFIISQGVQPTVVRPEIVADVPRKAKTHKFPAAQIFQTQYKVDLDIPAIEHIEAEIGSELKLWGQVCGDHWTGMTTQQKDSVTFRTKAVKYCLEDFRRVRDKESLKNPKQSQEPDTPDGQKKKTFTDYASRYAYGSKEYTKFKSGWLVRAEDANNQAAIDQVENYERLQLSLGQLQKRKGVKQG